MIEAPRLPRRPRIVPAVIVAIIIGAAGVTVAIDVIAVRANHHAQIWPYRQMATQMRQTHWGDGIVIAVAAALIAVGLILLSLAIVPGREKLIALNSERSEEAVSTTRKSLRRMLHRAISDLDAVDNVEVRLRRRAVRLSVGSPLRDPGNLATEARSMAIDRLEQIGVNRPPRVTVRVRHREND